MAHITPSMHHLIHQMVRFRLKFIEQVIYLPSTHLKSMTLVHNRNYNLFFGSDLPACGGYYRIFDFRRYKGCLPWNTYCVSYKTFTQGYCIYAYFQACKDGVI